MNSLIASCKSVLQSSTFTQLVAAFIGFCYGFTYFVCAASIFTSNALTLLLVGLAAGIPLTYYMFVGTAGKLLTHKRYGEGWQAYAMCAFPIWLGSLMFCCVAFDAFAVTGNANLISSCILGTLMALGLTTMPND